jgi:hypothetical protein
MSTLHLMQARIVIVPAVAVASSVLFLVIRRLSESPARKKARKLIAEVVQASLNISYMQADREALPSGIDEANRLLSESHDPEAQAKLAFKEKRYGDAQQHAQEALQLIRLAYQAQCPPVEIPTLPIEALLALAIEAFPRSPMVVIILDYGPHESASHHIN